MGKSEGETKKAADLYAAKKGTTIDVLHPLGIGEDGMVWPTSGNTAVKAFYRQRNFRNERMCYFRLEDAGIDELAGFIIVLASTCSTQFRQD